MKILHTADWHFGKTLYSHDLSEEMNLFLAWLKELILDQEIELILIAGDVFDIANPSHKDKKNYYEFLAWCSLNGIQVVVIAGNHDSPALMEATNSLLDILNIHSIGYGLPIEKQCIPIQGKNGEKLHILATPYLRDGDVRETMKAEDHKDKVTALREGIYRHYEQLHKLSNQQDESAIQIAMGHLYVQGAKTTDSEREIQIGNLAGLHTDRFSNLFDYFALGHIHRPQKFGEEEKVRYSGSPISLSFSERKDEKQVVILTVQDSIESIEEVKVPKFRILKRIKGTLEEVKSKLDTLEVDSELPAFVELEIHQQKRDTRIIQEAMDLAQKEYENFKIINRKVTFDEQIEGMYRQGRSGKKIEELSVFDVFQKRMDNENMDSDTKEKLFVIYDEILQKLNES